jgi:hypothetical protein
VAILKPTTRRCAIPHEPGEWIEIRRLASMGSIHYSKLTGDPEARLIELARYFVSAIVAWSYPERPSLDVIAGLKNAHGDREGGLDDTTAAWLRTEIQTLADGDSSDAALLADSSPSTVS